MGYFATSRHYAMAGDVVDDRKAGGGGVLAVLMDRGPDHKKPGGG